jgi:tRNA 2-thiouridine synthesizing protein A
LSQPITVDARGHRCPTPTLRLRRALAAAEIGACVRLLADDPMARIDVPLFVREAGHKLIEAGETDAGLSFLVRKLSSPLPDDAPAPA